MTVVECAECEEVLAYIPANVDEDRFVEIYEDTFNCDNCGMRV